MLTRPTTPTVNTAQLCATTDALRTYAACIFEDADIIEVRRLPINRDIKGGDSTFTTADELPGMAARLLRCNTPDNDFPAIYCGVNPRRKAGGRKAEDVLLARCLVVDIDHVTPEEAAQRIASMPPPTLSVATGHGAHFYWRLAEPIRDLSTWTGYQRDLIRLLDSDDKIKDPPRVLRLPGFRNWKEPPAPCVIAEADPTRVYDLADLDACIPHQQAPPASNGNGQPRAGLDLVARAASYLQRVPGAIEGQGGDQTTYRIACSLVNDFNLSVDQAWPLLLAWNETCSPPWDADELRDKLENAKKYASRPPGCKADAPAPERKSSSDPQTVRDFAVAGHTLTEVLSGITNRIRNHEPIIRVIPTGWRLLDETIGGLVRGEFTGVVGGPGCGKSTHADQMVVGALELDPNLTALVINLETAMDVRVARLIAARAIQVTPAGNLTGMVPVGAMLRGQLRDHAAERALEVAERFAGIADRLRFEDSVVTAGDIARVIEQQKPDLVLIDHLGLVQTVQDIGGDVGRQDAVLGVIVAALRAANAAGIIINELSKAALKDGAVSMTSSRGTARFASLAATFVGLERIRPKPPDKDPQVVASLVKARFGAADRIQAARFFGGLSYFAWGPVESATQELENAAQS